MIYLEATANIGMEAVLKREAQALGMKNIRVQDGLVSVSYTHLTLPTICSV